MPGFLNLGYEEEILLDYWNYYNTFFNHKLFYSKLLQYGK
jgi:hypothetical protein